MPSPPDGADYVSWCKAEIAAGRRLPVAEPMLVGTMAYRTPDGRLHPLHPEMLDRVDRRDRFMVMGPQDTQGTVAVEAFRPDPWIEGPPNKLGFYWVIFVGEWIAPWLIYFPCIPGREGESHFRDEIYWDRIAWHIPAERPEPPKAKTHA